MIKYRYQNQNFKKNLDRARGYKRKPSHLPSTSGEVFLSKIGLGSWKAKIFISLLLIAFIYVGYVPNMFTLKNIQVTGLKITDRQNLEKQIKVILAKKSFFPQNNTLFLSESVLKNQLANANVKIAKVESVNKIFPDTLQISVEPRYPTYLLSLNNLNYLISKDGVVIEIQPVEQSISFNYILLQVEQSDNLVIGQNLFNRKLADLLTKIKLDLGQNNIFSVKKFSLNPQNPQDLYVETKQGFTLKIDTGSSWPESLKNLQALFAKIPVNAKLAYIDLRVPDRAYVCFAGTTCANLSPGESIAGANTTTSSTLNSIAK